jgi:hypothetical protein
MLADASSASDWGFVFSSPFCLGIRGGFVFGDGKVADALHVHLDEHKCAQGQVAQSGSRRNQPSSSKRIKSLGFSLRSLGGKHKLRKARQSGELDLMCSPEAKLVLLILKREGCLRFSNFLAAFNVFVDGISVGMV